MLRDGKPVNEDNLTLKVRGAEITVTPEDIKPHLALAGVASDHQAARQALRSIMHELEKDASAHPKSGNPPETDVKLGITNALYNKGITRTCGTCGKPTRECTGHRTWHPWDKRPL